MAGFYPSAVGAVRMTKHRDSFMRTPHGGLVRSPHGWFNDLRQAHARTDHLLIVYVTTHSVQGYGGDMSSVYVPSPTWGQPGDYERGVVNFQQDQAAWEAVYQEFPTIAWLLQVTGVPGQFELEQLTPSGYSIPQEGIQFSVDGRPLSGDLTTTQELGIRNALNKWPTVHGYVADLRGVVYIFDLNAELTGPNGVFASFPDGSVPWRTAVEAELAGHVSDDTDEAVVTSTLDGRWLRQLRGVAAEFYEDLEP